MAIQIFFIFLSLFFIRCEATTFLVVRHGETDWNCKGIIQGQKDIPLNEKGCLQAQECAACIALQHADIKAIYSSDLLRASKTAEIFAKQIPATIFISPLLREVCQGEAEGMDWLTIKGKYKRVSSPKWTLLEIPGGETYEQILTRIQRIFSEIHQKHPNEKVLIVAHRLLIKTLSSELLDPYSTIDLMNCELLPIIYKEMDGKPQMTVLEKQILCH